MTDAGDALAPGTRLGELEVERVLGAGGFGVTYLARDLGLDAWRAVKEYLPLDWGGRRPDGTVGPRTERKAEDYRWGLEKFLEEARTLERFRHAHIVQVYRVFEAGGTAYMVMEYVEGRSLASKVKAGGPLPEAQVLEVLLALTDGLSSVHAVDDLLHRDISPDNVILRPDGTPVLIDFGAARQGLGEHSGSLTSVLKPGYAPLEQYPPGRGQGPWTDIYALGALAYYALSGEVPTVATERTREDPLPPLSEVAPRGVSRSLATAVDAALAVYAEDRPQSLAAWSALLEGSVERGERESVRAGTGVSRAGESRGDRSREEDSTRRWWLVGAGAAAVAGAVLVAALAGPWNGTGSDDGGDETRVDEDTVTNRSGESEDGAVEGGESGGETEGGEDAAVVDDGVVDDGVVDEDRSASAVEEALGLDRAARRLIQEGLTASGFDAGAADGLFGPETRRALRAWQTAREVPATGYLDAASTAALRTAGEDAARVAAQRQAEREAEAARQAEREAALAPGTVFRDCPTCPELVVVPAGEFWMGSPASEEGHRNSEGPQGLVRVRRFALGRYEVTFEEYERFVRATGRGRPDDRGWGGGRRPVIGVSWNDATAYAAWLSAETGLRYRLPSEAEWEYAARAGTETRYSWGNAIGRNRANCDGCGSRWDFEQTAPVGSFAANAWGLHDVHGNVDEWVEDCWHDSYRGAPSDGRAWTTGGNCGRRVSRGASWNAYPRDLRAANRLGNAAGLRLDHLGLRVARTLD